MVENIKIKQIKRVLSEEKKFLDNDEYENFCKNISNYLIEFEKTGKRTFYEKAIVFGEEKLVETSLSRSLSYFAGRKISEAIVSFNSNPCDDTFTKLINAYILDLSTFIAASENFKKASVSFLDSDIGLLYILTITFCPEIIDKVEPIILKGLQYCQQVRDNCIRPMRGSYGRDGILYLVYGLAREYNRNESATNQILSYCNQTIDPSCIKAVEKVFSNDETEIQGIIDELAEYHIKKSKTSDLTYPFHRNHWIYFPIEILGLLKIRADKKLNNSFISHPLINIFCPFLNMKLELESSVTQLLNKLL